MVTKEFNMNRYLIESIRNDLPNKIILLSGPRQVGKTTLAEMLGEGFQYLNFDSGEHRQILQRKSWDRQARYLIFDEIHKMKGWKRWLKGIYDTEKLKPPIIVTGSAKLDTYKKVGDSLAGRFFPFRLYPIDIEESCHYLGLSPQESMERLLTTSGFPEPFLKGSQRYYHRWQASHLDIMLRQDMLDLESVSNIKAMEILIDLLSRQVGSTISYSSLARNLEVSDKTIKRWLGLLENLYIIFSVKPYSKKISRSILKSPKYYFFDIARVVGDQGAKLENLVALTLHKSICFQKDCWGRSLELAFLRKKDGQEIDFFLLENKSPKLMLECKWSDHAPSKNFKVFQEEIGTCKKLQLIGSLTQDATYPDGLELRRADQWLSKISDMLFPNQRLDPVEISQK
jgi:predicted AAA+ superfamily ATPase